MPANDDGPAWLAEYIGWVARGGSGWVSLLETFTEAGHRVSDKSMSELERELRRLARVIELQKARRQA
jgi:hypothetical protein